MPLFTMKPKFYYEPKMDMHDKNECMDLDEYLTLFKCIDSDSSLTAEDKNFFKLLAT